MEESIVLIAREFSKEDNGKLFELIKEVKEYDGNFEGIDDIRNVTDYDMFLKDLERRKHQNRIKPDYSPQTTFGAFDDEKLVGVFVVRHALKGRLVNHGGNIGYFVRPSERKKGYGKQVLSLSLEKAKEIGLEKALVTCRVDNIGSAKVIEANGGVLENEYYDEGMNKTFKRYWITIN